ncbi:mitochondrial 54S ribosomal protein uL13m [Dipodascopsis tothii]|uniref:mitochondrial 54S ribosomal protein uL13m n=1 Tax=Dipodascopsis tothii TaxID=44089 RepID=UPI0034CECB80
MSQHIGPTKLAYSRLWHSINLEHEPRTLGRLATAIAGTLMGKHKPVFDPASDCGDYVVVTNAALLKLTGNKMQQKLYRHHTQRPGGLKEMTMERLIAKQGFSEVLRRAVSGMLPRNKLRQVRLERLKIFEGSQHPYEANLTKFWDESAQRSTED